jgi:hypothetical protein
MILIMTWHREIDQDIALNPWCRGGLLSSRHGGVGEDVGGLE